MSPGPHPILLLAPDPVLVHRDRLLDCAFVAERFGPVRRRRVKYRIGESLRVVYESRSTGDLFAARATRQDQAASMFERARHAATSVRGRAGVELDAQHGAVWFRLPNERRLAGVGRVLEPDREHWPQQPDWTQSDVAEYAPERSLTVRARTDGGHTIGYAKLYAPGTDVTTPARRAAALASTLEPFGVGVATARWVDEERAVSFLIPMPGETWSNIEVDLWPELLHLLGRAVALVHTHGISALARQRIELPGEFGRLTARRIVRSAELVGCARPDLAVAARRVANALLAAPVEPARTVLLHGDCHPKNALVDVDAISLIDLDQCGVGDPAADLGSLVARLEFGALRGEFDPARRLPLIGAALDGYASVRDLPNRSSLAWHTAAALLVERAVRAVNRIDISALHRLDTIVGRADVLARTDLEVMW